MFMFRILLITHFLLVSSCVVDTQESSKLKFENIKEKKRQREGRNEKKGQIRKTRVLFPRSLPGTDNYRLQKADIVIQSQCTKCHTGFHNSWNNFKTNEDWINNGYYIVPGNAENSVLIKSLKGHGYSGSMPLFSKKITVTELNILKDWINHLRIKNEVKIGFVKSSFYKTESDREFNIEIAFNKKVVDPFYIEISQTGGDATYSSDYKVLNHKLLVKKGDIKALIKFEVLDDKILDGTRKVELSLTTNSQYAVVGSLNKTLITIADNEKALPLDEVRFQKAYSIIKNKCANCHSSSIHNVFNNFNTSDKWVKEGKLISPGFSDKSLLLKRLKNYGSNMPIAASALSTIEVKTLKDWIDNLTPRKEIKIGFLNTLIYKTESDGEFHLDIIFDKAAVIPFDIFILRTKGDAVEDKDYKLINNIIKVKVGESKASVKLNLLDDKVLDGEKMLELSLGLVSEDAIIGSNKAISIFITDSYTVNSPADLRFQKAYTLIKNKCASCHTSSIHNDFNTLDTDQKWLLDGSYITAGDAENSLLLKRLKNYGSDMPIAADALLPAELAILKDWINNLEAIKKPQVNFKRAITEVTEDIGTVDFKVTLSKPLLTSTSFKIKTKYNSTLSNIQDYTFKTTNITFSAGEIEKTFSIIIKNDTEKEATENLNLSLELLDSKAILGQLRQTTLKVLDDDNIDDIVLNNSSISAHAPDRIYITSFLLHVFGPSSESYIDQYINKNHYLFGSKCDLYERSLGRADTGINGKGADGIVWNDEYEFKEVRPCNEDNYGDSIKTRSFEQSTVLRQAWITNFCENTIHDNPSALKYALAKKSLTLSSTVDQKNVGLIFDLFYPGKSIPAKFGTALIDLAKSNSSKKWESIVLTLCLSPEWQIP